MTLQQITLHSPMGLAKSNYQYAQRLTAQDVLLCYWSAVLLSAYSSCSPSLSLPMHSLTCTARLLTSYALVYSILVFKCPPARHDVHNLLRLPLFMHSTMTTLCQLSKNRRCLKKHCSKRQRMHLVGRLCLLNINIVWLSHCVAVVNVINHRHAREA